MTTDVMKYEDSRRKLLNYYTNRFAQYGEDIQSLGWSRESQQLRFSKVLSYLPDETTSLLDIGSGFGDLATYLAQHRPQVSYKGWEINPDFLAVTRSRAPELFEGRDILSEPPPANSFDVVVCIGSLNTQTGDNEDLARSMIERMYDAAKKMVIFSATSTHVDSDHRDDDKGIYYYDPAPLFTFSRGLSRKVDLIHSYLPHDFMLILRK